MAKKKAARKATKRKIEQYAHGAEKRANNPPVGLVTPETDPIEIDGKTYAYDPHLDPQLVWAGKAERTSFAVSTLSLHVHERIDPKTIIDAVRKRNGDGEVQRSLFEEPEENPSLRQALDFYRHPHGWSNRLIAGDALLVMNSLLEKEGMAGKVQMVYIDPPYGIRYGSNFQPFINKRDVKDGADADLTREPEMLKAFRDTWELGIHSYLTYLRDRPFLAKELLRETGSIFVQISDENLHHVRELMDEVFTARNFIGQIAFFTTNASSTKFLPHLTDHLIWFGKDRERTRYRQLYLAKELREGGGWAHNSAELPDGTRVRPGIAKIKEMIAAGQQLRPYSLTSLASQGASSAPASDWFVFDGRKYHPGPNRHWATTLNGMQKLAEAKRIEASANSIRFVSFLDDYPIQPINSTWDDTTQAGYADQKLYVVRTLPKVIERCLLMTTAPGDLVLDPTCGSGTTAYVAEQWGRRWITCDTSRVALTVAKQRLMTASYDYYVLTTESEGASEAGILGSTGTRGGFKFKTVPHVTLKSIANNPDIREGMTKSQIDAAIAKHADRETLYDQPEIDRTKVRVSGPFTVEAVPPAGAGVPEVRAIDEIDAPQSDGRAAARTGATLRQDEWRDELLAAGIRGKAGQRLAFARLEPLAGTRHIHAVGETDGETPQRVAVSFGPEHAPLEQRQVEQAWDEARALRPKPDVLLFAAFQFDPEAAKDIDELSPEKAGMLFLKCQMNADLLTDDLKKKRSSNESFWLIGQPDVDLRRADGGKWQVEVRGFDYYNPKSGEIDSGGADKIAMWMLDTDYDGRSVFPRQVFFPMAGEREGWARLAKDLKAEIDEELVDAYRGTVSLPFAAGEHRRVAVKIVDDRGIESLKLLPLE